MCYEVLVFCRVCDGVVTRLHPRLELSTVLGWPTAHPFVKAVDAGVRRDVARRQSVGDGRADAYFKVQESLKADPREFEVETLELDDVVEASAGHVAVRSELPKLRVDLFMRQEFAENVSIRTGAEIANTSQELKCTGWVWDLEPPLDELVQQLVAFPEILGVIHNSTYTAQ